MPNYMATYEYKTRTLDHVNVRKFHREFWKERSKKAVTEYLETKAKKHKLEEFKVLKIEKFQCLECCDTGMSRYDGCACC